MVSQNLIPQKKVLFTDGEGPLVFKDLAQDLMGRITFKFKDKEKTLEKQEELLKVEFLSSA